MTTRHSGPLFIVAALLPVLGPAAPALAQGGGSKGIWISPEELALVPASGRAWDNVKSEADRPPGTPRLSNQDDPENVKVLAKALVYARTGVERYRTEVISSCMAAIGTEGGETLALGRELIAYVIAADLVGLPPEEDRTFRAWLRTMPTMTLSGRTLISTHEDRPNNWGTHAGGSRAAVAAYLGDAAELARCAQVFKGWLGDRSSYAGFEYGELWWQADPARPVGINPKGSLIQGRSVDGVLPDDQRRSGAFQWPPLKENYVYEGLQGALAQAVILHRAGYDVWNWSDQALLRAFEWLRGQADFLAVGDDSWQPHLINYWYAKDFPAPVPSSPGKNLGWTDWTHGSRSHLRPGVHGSVKNGGRLLPGVEVALQAGEQVVHRTVSNANGHYRFVDVAPGDYRLSASSPGFDPWTRSISLAEGQVLFGQNISLRSGNDENVPPAPPKNLRATIEEQE